MNLLNRIIKAIKADRFNFENVRAKSSYFGKRCNVDALFVAYGQIGWRINTDEGQITYDYELDRICLMDFGDNI